MLENVIRRAAAPVVVLAVAGCSASPSAPSPTPLARAGAGGASVSSVTLAEPSASAAPVALSASAPPGPSEAKVVSAAEPAGAWMDDDVIAELAKDCRWDPRHCLGKLRSAAKKSVDSLSGAPQDCLELGGLACLAIPSQSCAPDECSQTDYACIPACDDACGQCSDGCTQGCEKCKARCQAGDATCKRECATGCAKCHQRCLSALDQCSTAHCAEVAEKCFVERDDEWNKSTCDAACGKVSECVEKCPDVPNDMSGREKRMSPCANACFNTLGKGCPSRFEWICKGDPDASVNFFAYHASRKEKH